MAWKDDMKNAKIIFKTGTTRQKLEYIWDYYKIHIMLFVFILFFIVFFIYTNVTTKDTVLQGFFLNPLAKADTIQEFKDDYLVLYPIDNSKEDIIFDTSIYYLSNDSTDTTSYQSLQVLTTRIAAGEIDFIIADNAILNNFSYNEYFCNLFEILTEDQVKKYEPYFLYYDLAVLEKINNIDFTSEEYIEIAVPDPSKPELMEQPVPVMIDVSKSDQLSTLYLGSSKNNALAFFSNSEHIGKALEFLEFIMN